MNHRHRQTGFTLIELVVSAVLTSMMMAAIFSIVWSTLKETQQLRQTETRQFPPATLTRQLRLDFQNSRGMQVDSEGVTLHGFVARNSASGRLSLTTGRVRYALRQTNGQRLLARTYDGKQWEPLWVGFGAMRIQPLEFAEPDENSPPMVETGGLPETPQTFRITLVDDDNKTLWREVIHHHEN
jgi:hypothetical protein